MNAIDRNEIQMLALPTAVFQYYYSFHFIKASYVNGLMSLPAEQIKAECPSQIY